MSVKGPVLRQVRGLVPMDHSIGASVNQIAPAARAHRINNDDAVGPLENRAVARRGYARCVVTMIASLGDVGYVDHCSFAAHMPLYLDRLQSIGWLRSGVTGEVIAHMLVLGGEDTVSAIDAQGDVND